MVKCSTQDEIVDVFVVNFGLCQGITYVQMLDIPSALSSSCDKEQSNQSFPLSWKQERSTCPLLGNWSVSVGYVTTSLSSYALSSGPFKPLSSPSYPNYCFNRLEEFAMMHYQQLFNFYMREIQND
jgi:hypothetical protein